MGSPISRVAVTGAAGYVAGRLIERLEREDENELVLATDIRPLTSRHSSKVVFERRDVTAPLADLLSEQGIDTVVHLAYVLNPRHDSNAAWRVNVEGTANILEACAQAGVGHILYLSSTSVYGAHADNPPLLTEESPVRPIRGFHYSEAKAGAESLLAEFSRDQTDCNVTVLRTCPVMGPNAHNFIARAFAKPFLVSVRGHDPAIQLLHEDDLVDVMMLCLRRRPTGVFNVAADGGLRWSEMARMFRRGLVAVPAPLLYGLTAAAWTLRLQSDSPACGLDFIRYPWNVSTEKIERELGATFRYSSRDAWTAFVDGPRAPMDETIA